MDRIGRPMVTEPSPPEGSRYGPERVFKPRLGQGIFRVLVTDVYRRRCAVTGERTLPVLEAAHVKPYAEGGTHELTNGILLRSDLHTLFDRGYVTITRDYRLEVSRRIREEFENGREYYALHGREVRVPPDDGERPAPSLLEWHNTHRFRG
jgi:putative restriction endonuclease